jgi:hypothetical protein
MSISVLVLAGILLPIEPSAVDATDPIDMAALADLRRHAAAGLSADERPAVVERSRAYRAKATAALRKLVAGGHEGDDESLVLQLCADVNTAGFSAYMTSISDLDNSLYSAEALQAWASALDLSLGIELPCLATLRSGVEALSQDLYLGFSERLDLILRGYNQNHRLKVFAAIGAARLALDQEISDHPLRLESFRQIERITHALSHGRGGYGEGPGYWAYQAIQTLPLMLAASRGSLRCDTDDSGFMPWTCQVTHASWRWAARMRVPADRPYFAPFDDTTPGAWFPFAMIPTSLAQALAKLDAASMGGGRHAAEVLAFRLRGGADHELPEHELIEDYLSGQLGLRHSGRKELLLMQAEHGRSAGQGRDQDGDDIQGTAGHNQSTPLSLMWFRHGRWRLIDPGYLGWSNRRPVAAPKHHSMPLLNGRGPQGPVPHVPRLIVDGNGGLTPADPSEEGGYILTPGGLAFGEVVSDSWRVLGPGWTLLVARSEAGGEQPEAQLRRLVFHHERGALAVVDVLNAEAPLRLDLHWQLPLSLADNADENGLWWVQAEGEDEAFSLRSSAWVDGRLVQPEPSINEARHDAGHWRSELHKQLALSYTGSSFVVLTVLGDAEVSLREDGQIERGVEARLKINAQLGWSLDDVSYEQGRGLKLGDQGAHTSPDLSAVFPVAEMLGSRQHVLLERFITEDEAFSADFFPTDGTLPGSLSRWLVALWQPHQAPQIMTISRPLSAAPEPPKPAQGCGCSGQSLPLLWGLALLLRRRRQRSKNRRCW